MYPEVQTSQPQAVRGGCCFPVCKSIQYQGWVRTPEKHTHTGHQYQQPDRLLQTGHCIYQHAHVVWWELTKCKYKWLSPVPHLWLFRIEVHQCRHTSPHYLDSQVHSYLHRSLEYQHRPSARLISTSRPWAHLPSIQVSSLPGSPVWNSLVKCTYTQHKVHRGKIKTPRYFQLLSLHLHTLTFLIADTDLRVMWTAVHSQIAGMETFLPCEFLQLLIQRPTTLWPMAFSPAVST